MYVLIYVQFTSCAYRVYSGIKNRNKFMYLIESTCKKNPTYITWTMFINILILLTFGLHLRWLLGLRKPRSSKKIEILQAVLVLRIASWKRFSYYGGKKQHCFLISAIKLYSAALSYLNAHSTLNLGTTFLYV